MRSIPPSLRRALLGLALSAVALVTACSSAPSFEDQVPPTSDVRQRIAARALSEVHTPYRRGTAGPNTFDDASLVQLSYRDAGHALPRTAVAQIDAGKPIALAQAQPGDLVFFRLENNGENRLAVGLFLKPGEMVMAVPPIAAAMTSRQATVAVIDFSGDYWQKRLVGAVRILGE